MASWGQLRATGALTHDGIKKTWKKRGRRETVIQALLMIDASPLMPQQVAVLVAGSFLACSWRLMSQRLQEFEHRGMQSLMEVWMIVAASFSLGQIARIVARNHPVDGLVRNYTAGQVLATASSTKQVQYLPEKEGLEPGQVVEPEEEDQDDVGVQKRIAQAEAAAKLAKYQNDLKQLLASIGKTDDIADDTQTLYKLADQLFSSPVNLCELVSQGGVSVVMSAAKSALKSLTQQLPQADVLPALMQVSWVLLQVAHGPPACCAALVQEDNITRTLLELANAVMAVPAPVEAKESILRNLGWVLLVLCDGGARSKRRSSSSKMPAASLSAAAVEAGAVQVMQCLASLEFGLTPGWVAAATLGLFMQQGQEQQQQLLQQAGFQLQQRQQSQLMTQAAVQALLQPDTLRGLGYLLNHQPQLSDRLKGLVYGQLHYMLSFHTLELLQLLIEEHLVGSFAAGASPKLGRLLVCQLLSVKGQEVMSHIEEAYELDVPLALAQVIPLPVHLKLPPAPQQQQSAQQQQQQHDENAEIEPDGESQPAVEGVLHPPVSLPQEQPTIMDDVYTDILACRLLLQHNRLAELLTAFTEELLTSEDVGASNNVTPVAAAVDATSAADSIHCGHGQAAAVAAEASQPELDPLSPVCDAVCKLIKYLMSRDLQLQAVQHMRGDSVDDTPSSLSSSSNSSAIDLALSMPDETGVYSKVLAGLVHEEQLPAVADPTSCGGSRDKLVKQGSGLLTLPALGAEAPAPCSCNTARNGEKCDKVVFQFGELRYAVHRQMYKRIKQSSKLVASVLGREKVVAGRPVTLFTTPHFTHEANLWVLQCLERWLATGALEGFNTQQAAKLWVAADFLQVDGLQVACEDVITAAAALDETLLDVALELCSRHRSSSNRLQRLVVQTVLKRLGSSDGLGQLKRLLQQHCLLLSPSLYADVRDRLVTLCMLNAGLDDDTPDDLVE